MSVGKNGNRYYNEEEFQRAMEQNNALEYAMSRGYDLRREGSYYRMRDHDSLVFSPRGYFAWNSHGIQGGNAIDFLVAYEGMSKVDAILTLAGTLDRPPLVGAVQYGSTALQPPRPFILPERAANHKQVFGYLAQTRGIDPGLVRRMLEAGQVYQGLTYSKLNISGYSQDGQALYQMKHPDTPEDQWLKQYMSQDTAASWDGTHALPARIDGLYLSAQTAKQLAAEHRIFSFSNLVMVGRDVQAIPRYASLRSMAGQKFRMDVTGSSKSVPFVIEGDNRAGDTVCTFESPIEAMSYWSLCKELDSDRIHCPMVSQGGANIFSALETYLKGHPDIRNIVVGLNNDSDALRGREGGANTGVLCAQRLQKLFGDRYTVTSHLPHLNDWNDVLCAYRKTAAVRSQPERPPAVHGKPVKAQQPER